MDIKRIDSYDDPRFSKEVLAQHGAFIIDDKYPCSFKIIGDDTAQVDYHDFSDIAPIIDSFRFFAEHIGNFCDKSGRTVASFEPVRSKLFPVAEIQPSQFYVDEDKIKAVSSFIGSGEDIVIPVMLDKRTGRYISLDGHTRMYYAYLQGYESIKVFESETNDYVLRFADEAVKRGVQKVSDITLLSHSEYEIKWNKFCDDFFERSDQN